MVPAAPEAVWARVTTPAGINDELRPWLRMTIPPELRGKTIADLQAGRALGRSRLLLFGALPVDCDDLFLAEIGPGYRFRERSKMLSMRVWKHERVVTNAVPGQRGGQFPLDRETSAPGQRGGHRPPGEKAPVSENPKPPAVALVTDRLGFELRQPLAFVPGAAALAAAVVRRLFRHRHTRLAAYFSA